MKLQRGNFTINNTSELDKLDTNKDGIRRVIDLSYMGQFEYEGNTVVVSRMYIEMNKSDYVFYPVNQYDSLGRRMFYYFNSKLLIDKDSAYLEKRAKSDIDRNYSLWEYMKYSDKEGMTNFWWDLNCDYFIFFGEEKKDIITYFIDKCYERDGKVEGIQKSLHKAGYKV